jgi:WD40 repeat protein
VKKNKHENYFVSAGDDNSVFLWDLRTHKPINFILAHSSSITSIDIFEDSSVILTTSDEGYR